MDGAGVQCSAVHWPLRCCGGLDGMYGIERRARRNSSVDRALALMEMRGGGGPGGVQLGWENAIHAARCHRNGIWCCSWVLNLQLSHKSVSTMLSIWA